jgi:hypothetical protein
VEPGRATRIGSGEPLFEQGAFGRVAGQPQRLFVGASGLPGAPYLS